MLIQTNIQAVAIRECLVIGCRLQLGYVVIRELVLWHDELQPFGLEPILARK